MRFFEVSQGDEVVYRGAAAVAEQIKDWSDGSRTITFTRPSYGSKAVHTRRAKSNPLTSTI